MLSAGLTREESHGRTLEQLLRQQCNLYFRGNEYVTLYMPNPMTAIMDTCRRSGLRSQPRDCSVLRECGCRSRRQR